MIYEIYGVDERNGGRSFFWSLDQAHIYAAGRGEWGYDDNATVGIYKAIRVDGNIYYLLSSATPIEINSEVKPVDDLAKAQIAAAKLTKEERDLIRKHHLI